MDIRIFPRKLKGQIHAIPSKSQAHRVLICSAFADKPTTIICKETNKDIEATAACLRALGATIDRTENGYMVTPISSCPSSAVLPCAESGSTLRFMLPIVGALGVDAIFLLEGRLPMRPLSPLWELMTEKGCQLSRPTENTLHCTGQLQGGCYQISGNVSSQFITGLLFALSLMKSQSEIVLTSSLESKPYVDMTQAVMASFGVSTGNYSISGTDSYVSPGMITIEGDWSNAAFFLAARAMGNDVSVYNLNYASTQGDRAVSDILGNINHIQTISAQDIPDLIPILAVVSVVTGGCTFTDIQRLRLKESDRVAAIINMLHALGVNAEATETSLTVYPGQFLGGTVDSVNDHRIAMAAAIAATASKAPVTILSSQCVEKSYPSFWDEYARLGGEYGQYIRK